MPSTVKPSVTISHLSIMLERAIILQYILEFVSVFGYTKNNRTVKAKL